MLLLIQLLLLIVAVELVGLIGKGRITDATYNLWLRISPSPLHRSQRTLKKDILTQRTELRATSSQDEFAKWARLRRKLDKSVADLEKLNGQIAGHKAQFGQIVTGVHFVVITALPFVFTQYHSKSAVYYLPQGWFGPAEWFLGLPFAPAGAVSCAVWTMMSRRAVSSIGRVVSELADGVLPGPKQAAEPVKVPAETEKATTTTEGKKEL